MSVRKVKAKVKKEPLKNNAPVSGRLNPKHVAFAGFYAASFNREESAIKAGYSPKSADKIATQLIANPSVRPILAAEIKKRIEAAELNSQMILRELARIAFSDIRDVMSWGESGGIKLKPSAELDEGAARAIESITETITETDAGRTIRREVKMHSKLSALDKLAKVFKMLVPEVTNINIEQRVTYRINTPHEASTGSEIDV